MIGAWCFLDHAGPATFKSGQGMKVGPHPHTGLQTFTWMIEGEVLHRDSLGYEQVIRPGQVNLMTAGHGIAHAEESLPGATVLHAAQLWIALPSSQSQRPPAFEHYPVLPVWEEQGCRFTLLAGKWGQTLAPTRLFSELVALELLATNDTTVTVPLNPAFEYGLLPLQGEIKLEGEPFTADELAYLGKDLGEMTLRLEEGSRVLLLGGAPFEEELVMWWNFVGHSRAEVIQAQRDWEAGALRFGTVRGYDGPALSAPPLPWKT
jgi:hypothetical protein